MIVFFWFFLIFLISFFLALRSMNDFNIPYEIKKILNSKKIKGTIIFFKNKIKHYYNNK
ncbi:MAG: hypothetical protein N2593_03925 [Patescibacteria group bacterium]|nr:hypothetical protein [Patescibacteria group bacterium]